MSQVVDQHESVLVSAGVALLFHHFIQWLEPEAKDIFQGKFDTIEHLVLIEALLAVEVDSLHKVGPLVKGAPLFTDQDVEHLQWVQSITTKIENDWMNLDEAGENFTMFIIAASFSFWSSLPGPWL